MEKTKQSPSALATVDQIQPRNASAGDQILSPSAAGYQMIPPSAATAKLAPPPFGQPELPFYAAKDPIVLVSSEPDMVIRDVTCACGRKSRAEVRYGASFVVRCYDCMGAYVADIPATPPVTTK